MSVNTWGAVNTWLAGLSGEGFTLLGSIEAPTLTGAATGVPLLVKPNTEFTAAMLASLDVGGGDLRFSSDATGLNQLPCEVVDGLDVVWVKPTGVSISTGATLYVWGDNTGASQPAVGAAFGRNAVWVDSDRRYNLNGDVGAVLVDSTGNDDGALVGSVVSAGAVAPYGTSSTNLGGTGYYNGINDPTSGASSMYCGFWINSIDTTSTGVVGSYIDNTNTSFLVYMASSTSVLRFRVSQAGSAVETEATTLVHGDGLDHFIQCHYSGSDLKIYVDGVLEGTTPRTGVIGTPSTAPFNIGAWASDNTRRVNSRLQGLTLSTSTVTTDQISIEYDNQSELGAWWIASDVAGGTTTVTGVTPNYNYAPVNGTVDLTPEITVTGATPNYNYAPVSGTIDLTPQISVTGATPNYTYTAIVGTVETPGAISVTGTTPNYTYAPITGSVSLQGTLTVTGQTPSFTYAALSGRVTDGIEVYTNSFIGFDKEPLSYSGYVKTNTFSGIINEQSDFTGIIKTISFSGVLK